MLNSDYNLWTPEGQAYSEYSSIIAAEESRERFNARLYEASQFNPNMAKCECGNELGFHYNDLKICGVCDNCTGFKEAK